jgi:hypothetical protein
MFAQRASPLHPGTQVEPRRFLVSRLPTRQPRRVDLSQYCFKFPLTPPDQGFFASLQESLRWAAHRLRDRLG